jgi:hypothetical protein
VAYFSTESKHGPTRQSADKLKKKLCHNPGFKFRDANKVQTNKALYNTSLQISLSHPHLATVLLAISLDLHSKSHNFLMLQYSGIWHQAFWQINTKHLRVNLQEEAASPSEILVPIYQPILQYIQEEYDINIMVMRIPYIMKSLAYLSMLCRNGNSHLPGRTKEYHKIFQSQQPASWQRFEPDITWFLCTISQCLFNLQSVVKGKLTQCTSMLFVPDVNWLCLCSWSISRGKTFCKVGNDLCVFCDAMPHGLVSLT